MNKGRLEAFSDGVIAIIITIMVLEFKVPIEKNKLSALIPLIPTFLGYILSFIYVGIYWNNHHHMFAAVNKINGRILWANLHLLFWLSMVPFATAWMGDHHLASAPTALYGFILLMCAIAYKILASSLVKHHGKNSLIAKAIGNDIKGKLSIVCYALGIFFAFYQVYISAGIYIIIALLWLIPDKRIENIILQTE